MKPSSTQGNGLSHLLSAMSSGLLIGVLVGLSSSPVVGSLVGTLATVAVAFLTRGNGLPLAGLRKSSAEVPGPDHSVPACNWLTVFCLMCLSGVFAGIWIRTHNLLSPSVKSQVETWEKAGFGSKQAQSVVANLVTRTASDSKAGLSVLFADGSLDDIELLKAERFLTVADIARGWRDLGGPFERELADRILAMDLSDSQKREVFQSVWEAMQKARDSDK